MCQKTSLSGKQILITGASSGIGRATAITCSRLGAVVMLLARNEKQLKLTLDSMEGNGHDFFLYDLCNVDGLEKLINKIVEKKGPLDGFVHCAGVDSLKPLSALKPGVFNEIMTVNFYSFVEIVRGLAKRKAHHPGMSIVGISSISSQRGDKAKTAYSSSKAALDAAVRCLAKELSPKGIRINSVLPALIDTALSQCILDTADSAGNPMTSIGQRQYAGMGKPEDIANFVSFLLSDDSRQITGANLDISGGFLSN